MNVTKAAGDAVYVAHCAAPVGVVTRRLLKWEVDGVHYVASYVRGGVDST